MNLHDSLRKIQVKPQYENDFNIENNGSKTGAKDAWLLYRGIKSLLECDESETVQGIASYVISKYDSLRIGSEFVERNRRNSIPLIATFLGAVTRFLEGQTVHQKNGIIWIARLDNERRAIEKLPELIPDIQCVELKLRRPPDMATISLLPRRLFPLRKRIIKLTRLLLKRKHKFFKILRVIEMIGYYARFLEIFQRGNYDLAVMSSHSNPHGIAFNMAARRCGVPAVLVTHGMPVRPVARLNYDLAVVHCELASRIYKDAGCRISKTLIHGRKQDHHAMPVRLPEKLKLGIFLCKDVNEKKLEELVRHLLTNSEIEKILIRPHPKNLFIEFDDWITSLSDGRACRSSNNSAKDDLKECDIVLGGNSSVLVEAVTAGCPSGYIRGLDYGSIDLHEFVARGLIYPAENINDFGLLLEFYRKPAWTEKLRLYANINETKESAAEGFRDALQRILCEKDKSL